METSTHTILVVVVVLAATFTDTDAAVAIGPARLNQDICASTGGELVDGKCLTFNRASLSWSAAKDACATNGGRLASFNNTKAVYDYITTNHPGIYYWTGGSDTANEGTFTWLDGRTFVPSPWYPNRPWANPADGNPYDCVEIVGGTNGGYGDYVCSAPRAYICEIGGCVGNAVAIGSQCLTISNEDDKLNWNSAVAACEAMGKRLAKLKNPADVYEHVIRFYHNDEPGYENFYVGASDIANEGSWVWIDGQPLDDKFPWRKTGSPEPNGGRSENCLVVAADPNHRYIDAYCGYQFRYICEDVNAQE